MKLIAITNDPQRARACQDAGVDRIMVDLEINGKEARQGHLDTLISRHQMADVSALRSALTSSAVMVRTNPLFAGTRAEVDEAIARGADRLMLPMFHHPDDASAFLDHVGGRAAVTLLVETAAAFARLPRIVSIDAPFDLHFGLNDLHLEYRLDFMFELFTSGLLDHAAGLCAQRQVPFGIGGIARVGKGLVPGDMVAAEHVRLGSTAVILSRDFSDHDCRDPGVLKTEVAKIRAAVASCDGKRHDGPSEDFRSAVQAIADQKRQKARPSGSSG